MKFQDRYPLIVTQHKDACRDFWVQKLGLSIGFDSSWFVWLYNDDQSLTIAFMTPDHPSAPPGADEFSGKGVTFELQVEDAATAFNTMQQAGVPITYPLTDEPFGQRRFGFSDPSGLWVDVCEQTEPAAGFWDKYMIESSV